MNKEVFEYKIIKLEDDEYVMEGLFKKGKLDSVEFKIKEYGNIYLDKERLQAFKQMFADLTDNAK